MIADAKMIKLVNLLRSIKVEIHIVRFIKLLKK